VNSLVKRSVVLVLVTASVLGGVYISRPSGTKKPSLEKWEKVYSFAIDWEEISNTPIRWSDIGQEEKSFLTDLQRRSFLYFWEKADQVTGLVYDRASNPDISSIAATGFGLSAICVAEANGWISKDEAYQRVLRILKNFDPDKPSVEGKNGFFYHFVNARTGRRAWMSEISSIDTAILIAGALHAGQHFKGTEIESLASRIYKAVQWDWMLLNNGLLSMGWTPEGGFLSPASGYSEYILAYILALGSPTHSIPPKSWDTWTSTFSWYSHDGRRFLTPGGRTMLAYLYQFPACWIDFRNIHDGKANYWLEGVAALKANRLFCLEESRVNRWPAVWGWTACDGINGYLGFRNTFDGTVAPSAVAAAIPFIPENAILDLMRMYWEYSEKIWGEYGFVNAFNPSQNWFDNDYIGIDQGNTVLMLEAFKSGSVWKEFMSIPYIINALRKAGFVEGFHHDSGGFVKDWIVIGPFGLGEAEAFNSDFVGETSLLFYKSGERIAGREWVEHHAPYGDPVSRFIDFCQILGPYEETGAYAFTVIYSPSKKTVELRVGSDDSVKVWINGKLVHSNRVARAAAPDQDIIPDIRLEEGTNTILVKVCNKAGGWGFYLRILEKK